MRRGTVRGVSPVRVLLVDDHQMLTEALAARLSATPDIVVVGHCGTRDPHPEVLATVTRPDVITLEVTLARDAAPLLTLVRTAWPPAHFVVLTASRDPEQAVEAARAGALGWVSKESSIDTLTGALRCASRGQACFPPEQLGRVLRELRADVERALSESESRFRALFEGAATGIGMADIDGRIIQANAALGALLAYRAEAHMQAGRERG